MLVYNKNNKNMVELDNQIKKIAKFNVPCLITGETGTGKTLIAEYIHKLSPRKKENFISINCGGIPDSLLEAELFGYSKGAFTGAINARKGMLRSAEGGTVFLDEIGNMPFSVQSKLLTFLDSKQVRPIGTEAVYTVNVRIIAATNMVLENALKKRQFRLDLYHRLNVVNIETIPLRKNLMDLVDLSHYFLHQINKELKTNVKYISCDAFKILQFHPFEGNARELKNILYNAVINHSDKKSNEIEVDDLPKRILRTGKESKDLFDFINNLQIDPELSLEKFRSYVEPNFIRRVLQYNNFNITRSAEFLGISIPTLHKYIKKYNLMNKEKISCQNSKEVKNESKQNNKTNNNKTEPES